MSHFNSFERSISKFLHSFPRLKKLLKVLYSKYVFSRNKKNYNKKTKEVLLLVNKDESFESFFGYYDKSPENDAGFVLSHLSKRNTKQHPSTGEVDIAVFDRLGNLVYSVRSSAFNWQQGTRAHWISDDAFIFNDFDEYEKVYISKVISLKEGKEVRNFLYPVQDSYKDNYFLSINYRRLMALRPDYGYRNLPRLTTHELHDLTNDGIWKIDYKTGKASLIVTIEEICNLNRVPDFERATHKVNHVMISPSGEKFIFMHRYLIGGERFDRLLLADSSNGSLKLLGDYGMVSHCYWSNDNTVLGYMRGPENLDGYWLIDVDTGVFRPCIQNKLSRYGDGHPHVHGEWFVTDTYPDKARMQHLLLCNWNTGEVRTLGEFFHGFEYSEESRCDLHPRFSPDGRSVFFDSVFSGKRQLYRMELSN